MVDDEEYRDRIAAAIFKAVVEESKRGDVALMKSAEIIDAATMIISLMLETSPSVKEIGLRKITEEIAARIRKRYTSLKNASASSQIFTRVVSEASSTEH